MSLTLLQGYSSPEEEEEISLSDTSDEESQDYNNSSKNNKPLIPNTPLFDPSNPPSSKPSSLPSAFDVFSQVFIFLCFLNWVVFGLLIKHTRATILSKKQDLSSRLQISSGQEVIDKWVVCSALVFVAELRFLVFRLLGHLSS